MLDRISLRLCRLYHLIVGFGILFIVRHPYRIAVKFINDYIKSADVIRVRVGSYYIIKMRDSLTLQIGLYRGSLIIVSRIYQHSMVSVSYQGAIPLSDIEIMHLQCRAV